MHTKQMVASAIVIIGLGLNDGTQVVAQTYPARPIKLITPYGPGSPPDLLARVIAQQLSATVGQVIVENRPGAGGTLGAKAVAAATPDGHVLLFGGTGPLAISPATTQVNYDLVKSFAPVATIANDPLVLVTTPSTPINSIADLVAYARAHPGKLNYGATNGVMPHATAELFKMATGADIAHVPYRVNSQAIVDVMAGRIQMTFDGASALLPFISEGKLRPVAVTSATRSPLLPDVPTMRESGLADFLAVAWLGILAPAETSADIVNRLNAEINAGLKSAEMRTVLAKLGAEPAIGSPQDLAALIAAEILKWSAVVKAANIKMD